MQENTDSLSNQTKAGATAPAKSGMSAPETDLDRKSLAPGTIKILGQSRYELREFVTKGGMGAVYRAWDHHLNRQVAVKCLLDVNREGSKDLASQEARTLASLTHPNILRVYDILTEDEQVWIVSEWVEGVCLAELLNSKQRLPEPIVISIMAQIFSALASTHDSNVFHRDIKPANVMIGKSGQITLIDFGVAYSPGFSTGETLVGSLRYTDPRILEGAAPDARSDLFSAALMQMELMTGEKVLPDLAPIPLYRHISKSLSTRIATLGDGCFPPLTSLVTRLALTAGSKYILTSKEPGKNSSATDAAEAGKCLVEMLRQYTDNTPETIISTYLAKNFDIVEAICADMIMAARTAISNPSTPAREKGDWISYVASCSEISETSPQSKPNIKANLADATFWTKAKNTPAMKTLEAVRHHKWAEIWLAIVVISLAFAVRSFNQKNASLIGTTQTEQADSSITENFSGQTLHPARSSDSSSDISPIGTEDDSTATSPTNKNAPPAMYPVHIVANAWANVSVDGREIGQLPNAKPFMLSAGSHKLYAESPYVEPLDIIIEVGPGMSEKIQLTLKAKLAPRVIKLGKPGQLFVDGVDYGIVESKALTLSYGKHEVVIKRGNQVIRPTPITVSPETGAEIRVEP